MRPLDRCDADSIVDVHCSAFPSAALTKLGREAVKRYYLWQLRRSGDMLAVGAYDKGVLQGFCIAGVSHDAISGFLSQNRSFLLRRMLVQPWLIANPLFRERIVHAVKRVGRIRGPSQNGKGSHAAGNLPACGPAFDVLAVAVRADRHWCGFGTLLMEEAESAAWRGKFHAMTLCVGTENHPAIRFYEKLGWEKHARAGEPWAGVMEKWLMPKEEFAARYLAPRP